MVTDHTSSIIFSMISFDFNLSNLSFLGVKKTLYITSHHASGLCLTQLDNISLSQKVNLHSPLDLICPSMISETFSSVFIYMIVCLVWLAYHLWRNIPLFKLHGIQKKWSVNNNKTKRYGNSNFLLEVI